MSSTSKSNRRKIKKPVRALKQQWQVKQPSRNWLELPSDIMANILLRIGAFDILENAQKVCTAWRKICKDPAMWRVIDMKNHLDPYARPPLQKMCMNAVDRSQGELVDISIRDFGNDELLLYVANRSSQLKRLQISCSYGDIYESWPEALKKFPLLEELSLHFTDISKEAIEAAGRYCPMLKTLKVNQRSFRLWDLGTDDVSTIYNKIPIAIGENLRELRHLELIGSRMSNTGLQAILDGCCQLESLDLRCCWNINLDRDLKKRCSQQIKCLRLPNDSLDGCAFTYRDDSEMYDVSPESELYLDDVDVYFGYSDYDDFTAYYGNDDDDDSIDLEDLNEMLIFKAMFG